MVKETKLQKKVRSLTRIARGLHLPLLRVPLVPTMNGKELLWEDGEEVRRDEANVGSGRDHGEDSLRKQTLVALVLYTNLVSLK